MIEGPRHCRTPSIPPKATPGIGTTRTPSPKLPEHPQGMTTPPLRATTLETQQNWLHLRMLTCWVETEEGPCDVNLHPFVPPTPVCLFAQAGCWGPRCEQHLTHSLRSWGFPSRILMQAIGRVFAMYMARSFAPLELDRMCRKELHNLGRSLRLLAECWCRPEMVLLTVHFHMCTHLSARPR